METRSSNTLESHDRLSENPPEIRLHFFRHDEKAANTGGTDESDYAVRLTATGRKQAAEHSPYWQRWHKNAGTFVFGSPRERSLETALLRAYPETAIHSTMEETQSRLNTLLGLNNTLERNVPPQSSGKIKNWAQTENLNFAFGSGAMRPIYDLHYLQEKDLLHYVYTQSDKDLIETGDTTAKSYSLYAAGTAKEILRSAKVLSSLLRHDETKNSSEKKHTEGVLQNRFYGSHQSVTECFILKVLEKTGGTTAAEKFLDELAGKQGFAFSEGFEVSVQKQDIEPSFLLKFRTLRVPFSLKVLEEIIQEGAEIEAQMKKS